jgi:hypothetical protein
MMSCEEAEAAANELQAEPLRLKVLTLLYRALSRTGAEHVRASAF